jgi:hypothetical protein
VAALCNIHALVRKLGVAGESQVLDDSTLTLISRTRSDPMSRVVRTTVPRVVAACFVAFIATAGLAESPETDSSSAIRHSRRIALAGKPRAVAVSGDGKTIVAASGKVMTAIDASNGKVMHRWEQSKDIVDVSVSANGRLIAVTTGSPIIDVYDKETGERSQQLHRNDAPDYLRGDEQRRIAFYPDGSKLISSRRNAIGKDHQRWCTVI